MVSITGLILSLHTANSNSASDALSQNKTRILAYGDSLTAGFRLSPQDSYPSQLQALLSKEGYSIEITNGGVSGDTSAQALARLDWNLQRGGPYQFVLLGIGANDGLRQLDLKLLKKNIQEMIERFQTKGIRVVLLGQRLPLNLDAHYRRAFEDIYKDIARTRHLTLIPFALDGVATNPQLNLEDQIHPNAQGYAIVATNVARVLRPLLKKMP